MTAYLLVDGENIDATLGGAVLNRRPSPEERPRWNQLVEFLQREWGDEVKALFFLNATTTVPMPFVQALSAMGYRPVLLRGGSDVKVVDVGIQRTLQALRDREGDVVLASHDGDFAADVAALLARDEDRRVGVLGFREFVSVALANLEEQGLELFDIEHDAAAFTYSLPRIRVIDLDDFDPLDFL